MKVLRSIFRALRSRTYKNSSRTHLRNLCSTYASAIPPGARILDAGAGNCPYRKLFNHATYESADLQELDKEYDTITYRCDLADIPVEDERFDFILLNQTLEHLPDPQATLRELSRVLRPKGRILCTAPFFYEEHEQPYDFYRYTQFAHRFLFERAGFLVEKIDWLEGYYGTLGYQLDKAAVALPTSSRLYGGGFVGHLFAFSAIFVKLVFLGLSGLLLRLDERFRLVTIGYPKNYVVLASKQ